MAARFSIGLLVASGLFFLLVFISLGISIADKHAQAFATTLVGMGAFFIGFIQWRSNESKVKLDYYNKRYAIYAEMQNAWNRSYDIKRRPRNELQNPFAVDRSVTNYNDIRDDIFTSRLKCREATFLFDQPVIDHIDSYYDSLAELIVAIADVIAANDQARGQLLQRQKEARHNTLIIYTATPPLLKRYLDISHIL